MWFQNGKEGRKGKDTKAKWRSCLIREGPELQSKVRADVGGGGQWKTPVRSMNCPGGSQEEGRGLQTELLTGEQGAPKTGGVSGEEGCGKGQAGR